MILVNGSEMNVEHFPDNTQRIMDFDIQNFSYELDKHFDIEWHYENDSECMTLFYFVNHIREYVKDADINLIMSYIPNARMDRAKHECEVFTLKYFSKFINSLNFNKVFVLDPHSDVSTALINNVKVTNVEHFIRSAIYKCELNNKLVIYFPDAGAMKRYKDYNCFKNYDVIYGNKVRDWETGKIKGIEILDRNGEKFNTVYSGKVDVLMIDDIISYGGTLAYSADELKKLGFNDIYAYASHVENSILDEEKGTLLQRLKDGTVKHVFTTNSIYNGKSEYISIINYPHR